MIKCVKTIVLEITFEKLYFLKKIYKKKIESLIFNMSLQVGSRRLILIILSDLTTFVLKSN